MGQAAIGEVQDKNISINKQKKKKKPTPRTMKQRGNIFNNFNLYKQNVTYAKNVAMSL